MGMGKGVDLLILAIVSSGLSQSQLVSIPLGFVIIPNPQLIPTMQRATQKERLRQKQRSAEKQAGQNQPVPQKLTKQQSKKRKQLQKQKHLKPATQVKICRQEDESEQQESDQDIDLNQVEQVQGLQPQEASFLVAEINEQYYHSLKTILFRYAQITKTDNAALADAVVSNKPIGNLVLADDDSEDEQEDEQEDDQEQEQLEDDEENAYSVLTIISGKKKLSKAIKKTVLKSAEVKTISSQLQSLISNQATSVLINERLPNLPAFVVSSTHEVFKKDLGELKQKERKKWEQVCSGYLVNVSEVQVEDSEELDKLVYSKFEDYEMCQRAQVWWLGERNSTFKKKADMRNLYYLIKAEEYLRGADRIKTYLQE